MTPVPDELVALRLAVARSFDIRDGMWRPDPRLLEHLLVAEGAWARELLRRRNEEEVVAVSPPEDWDPQGAVDRIRGVAHTYPEYLTAERRKAEEKVLDQL